MFKRIRTMHPVTGVVVGVVATLVLSSTAMAVTDTSFTYSTAKTGYLMIGPGDLVPMTNVAADDYGTDAGAYSAQGACFVAPVHLPHGARMTWVRTTYSSFRVYDPYWTLTRTFLETGRTKTLVGRVGVDDSGVRRSVNDEVASDVGLIVNTHYAYTYRVCVGSGDFFFGARITYTYTNAGD